MKTTKRNIYTLLCFGTPNRACDNALVVYCTVSNHPNRYISSPIQAETPQKSRDFYEIFKFGARVPTLIPNQGLIW